MLVGQEKLRNHLYTMGKSGTLPKMIILEGPKGQGKKTLALALTSILGDLYAPNDLKVDDIREMIDDAQSLSRSRVYLLSDADRMTNQAQNALLKFSEEPTRFAYIIITLEHRDNILTTIKSRASIFQLEPYSKEDLMKITQDNLLLQICSNPGQIQRLLHYDYELMIKTAAKVVDNIGKINTANAFNILKHFELEDADLFINSILYILSERMLEGKSYDEMKNLSNLIGVIYQYNSLMNNKSINKKNLLEMMFIEMRDKSK